MPFLFLTTDSVPPGASSVPLADKDSSPADGCRVQNQTPAATTTAATTIDHAQGKTS
jgi:hypothetical protein